MRLFGLTLLLLASATVMAAPAAGWRTGATGRGTAHWTEESDRLVYRGNATYAWAVKPGAALADGFAQVRFQALAGREDQAGGVVWRWQDPDNYYVARANALEGNVVAYQVVGGRRTDLKPGGAGPGAYGVKVPVPRDTWHVLRVDFRGAEARVTFNGRALFTVHDETFLGPGAVGVWSKADSVTEFADFESGAS